MPVNPIEIFYNEPIYLIFLLALIIAMVVINNLVIKPAINKRIEKKNK